MMAKECNHNSRHEYQNNHFSWKVIIFYAIFVIEFHKNQS